MDMIWWQGREHYSTLFHHLMVHVWVLLPRGVWVLNRIAGKKGDAGPMDSALLFLEPIHNEQLMTFLENLALVGSKMTTFSLVLQMLVGP